MSSKRRIFIAGNGPSLREVDFEDLRSIDWLGMNAAYRHWDKIGVYPTIYSCLDKVVVKSHAQEILRLHAERKVDKFFLVKDILEEIPDFPQDDRVFFLEDMVTSTAPGSEIFKTAFSDKKTTGSWAVRFVIFLGYREIYLSGIDCSYVEVISEAKRTGVGLELKVESQVANNPNYFFNDYQKQGDVYQVPNPERHFGNLHLQSFEAMNVDIARLGLDVVIRNTARGSQLNRFGVYGYLPLKEALHSPSLQAVAVPLTMGEYVQLIRNLQLWDAPAFHPLRLDSPLVGRIALHVFFDGERDDDIVAAIENAWNATARLKHMFSGLEISFLSIPRELNSYIRDARRTDVPRKMGPNLHFLAMMRRCEKYRYTQLMESDCVPVKSDWLTDLDSACVRSGPFWIAGAYLDTLGAVSRGFALQINGNAIYATGDPEFIRFMAEVFLPALRYLVLEKTDFSLAYDCLISRLMTYALSTSVPKSGVRIDPQLDGYVQVVQANLDRFRFVRLYRNISHIDSQFTQDELMAMLESDCVIVHSRRLTGLVTDACLALGQRISREVESRVLQRRLKDTFIKVRHDEFYAFHYYSNLDGCVFDVFDRTSGVILLSVDSQALLDGDPNKGAYLNFALGIPTKGKSIRCEVELIGETSQRLLLRLARNGAGKFIEDRVELDVTPGLAMSPALGIECLEDYSGVRLQLKPVAGAAGRLKMRFRITCGGVEQNWLKATVNNGAEGVSDIYDAFRHVMCPDAELAPPAKTVVPATLAGNTSRARHGNRLLIIDSTPMGRHGSATGQLKSALLAGWAESDICQVFEAPNGGAQPLRFVTRSQTIEQASALGIDLEGIVARCRGFAPDVIYVRPTESLALLRFTDALLTTDNTPAVIHIMDDWPERLRFQEPTSHAEADVLLRKIITRSAHRLSICDAMSKVYGARYGGRWQSVANGVELDRFGGGRPRAPKPAGAPFIFRYMGGLAVDMNLQSVLEFARAISVLQSQFAMRLEIYTMPWYKQRALVEMGSLPGVEVLDIVPSEQYEQVMASADALLLAYNFDPASIRYIGLSLANKLPECLASGVPLLAYGPASVATMQYLQEADCSETVVEQKDDALQASIKRLVIDVAYRNDLAQRARHHAEAKLDLRQIRLGFQGYLLSAAASQGTSHSAQAVPGNDLRKANTCFREGRYQEAMGLYRSLYSHHKLGIYRDNVQSCARKLGLTNTHFF